MRILVVHNNYGLYSGEEAVVDRMIDDGRKAGHFIETLRLTSEGSRDTYTGKVRGFFAGIYSFRGRRLMRKALTEFHPDIVHVHNLYPFISPAVLPICKRHGVPVVMTVHNYRLICPTGLFLRDGKPCEECLNRGNEFGCLRHNCEHSLFRSVGYTLRNMVARKTRAYIDNVDYFCCLTDFQRQKLIAAGFDESKIRVFPNYVDLVEPDKESNNNSTERFVGYVGRLSHEKGYDLLLKVARRHPEIEFRFAGTIRDGGQIDVPDNVTLCGQLDAAKLASFYVDSAFIVIPSRCYEGFPVALLEASSHSRCCIAPSHGAFPDLMTNSENGEVAGLLFTPLDVDDLERKVISLWQNKEKSERLGKMAEQNYKSRFLKQKVNADWNSFLKEVTQ